MRPETLAGPDPLRARLASVRRLLVLTGAGVSRASGLPLYRGEDTSLYADPENLRYAMASTLHRDPAGVWAHFGELRRGSAQARPNPAHQALATLEEQVPTFLLATQNVDGLHARAGSRALVELHGSLTRARCLEAACPQPAWALTAEPTVLPRCPHCGGPARPDVVLFGEGADWRWEPLRRFVAPGVDLLLLVGTSGVVEVPTQLVRLTQAHGDPWVVEVNPRPTPPDSELGRLLDAQLALPAEMALPALLPPPPSSSPREREEGY